MNRQDKEQVIASLKKEFAKSSASFLVKYSGLTVAQMADLRRKLRKEGGALQVAKVTLIERAVDDIPEVKEMSSLLGNQIALVFAQQEPPAVAKVLYEFSKKNEQLRIVGGCYESSLLTEEAVKIFASLPPRPILLAQVCGTLKAPLSKLARTLNMVLLNPVLVIKQIEKKKSS
ncbi:MAG: 50S ribosomal protein L10 [Candidatus Babeliales bacterium]